MYDHPWLGYVVFLLGGIPLLLLLLAYYRWRRAGNREPYMFLKMIGLYYLCGSTTFIGESTLPLGFILYLFIIRPKHVTNQRLKWQAALLGLLAFGGQLVYQTLPESYTVKASEELIIGATVQDLRWMELAARIETLAGE